MGMVHPYCLNDIQGEAGRHLEEGPVRAQIDFITELIFATSLGLESCCKGLGQVIPVLECCGALQCNEELSFIPNFFSALDTYF